MLWSRAQFFYFTLLKCLLHGTNLCTDVFLQTITKVTGSYWEIWANNPYVNSFLEFETEKPFQTKEGKCSIRATSL